MPTFRAFALATPDDKQKQRRFQTGVVFVCTFSRACHTIKPERKGGIRLGKQLSPFAELTGDEKQIRWLEYQSLRLPYIQTEATKTETTPVVSVTKEEKKPEHKSVEFERPQPPPEVPRVMPVYQGGSRHSQYDAVIARMKQAELQSRRYQAMSKAPQ